MHYNFDQSLNRRSTESIKWLNYDEDVLPMWVADMDFRSPQPVIEALQGRVQHGVFGYPKVMPELNEIFRARLLERYGWQVQAEDLVFLPGVVAGFNLACHTLNDHQGGVLVQTPVYKPILSAPENAGMQRQEAALARQEDGSYQVDWNGFRSAIDEQTRLFLLCNPHNPVGRVYKKEELECMADICLQHNLLICSDEIHCDLTYPGHPHTPIATLDPEVAQNTITLMAPSKTFNLAGFHCAVGIIQNPALREAFVQARQGLVGGADVLGLVAARAAYAEGQEWLEQLLVYLQANRDFLYQTVCEELPGIKMARPEGTYLGWLDCREIGLEEAPCDFFLEKARVAVNDGEWFGRGGTGFVRLNFGCPRFMLAEALERMKMALQSLR